MYNLKSINPSKFIKNKYPIIDFLGNQSASRIFYFILIIFFFLIIINYYFSNKLIISFIPLIILSYLLYLVFVSLDKDVFEKKKFVNKFIDYQKFPMIYKYNELLSILNEINYLKYFNQNAYNKALYYTNSYLEIYDYIVNDLETTEADSPENYSIIEKSEILYNLVLNELMSIIINIPPFYSYIQNINIPRGFVDDFQYKIKKLQNIFVDFQIQMNNFVNKLLNMSVNTYSNFFHNEDLTVKPNPTNLLEYSSNFNLY